MGASLKIQCSSEWHSGPPRMRRCWGGGPSKLVQLNMGVAWCLFSMKFQAKSYASETKTRWAIFTSNSIIGQLLWPGLANFMIRHRIMVRRISVISAVFIALMSLQLAIEQWVFSAIFVLAIVLYILSPHAVHALLVRFPLHSMNYIMNQPMGIKQNTVIKTFFGTLFKHIIRVDTGMDFAQPLQICSSIIFSAYSYNTMILMDIFDLLRGKTYNPKKKRTDTIQLSVDQIVLSVFLFSFGFIIYTNLVVYYMYFVFLSCMLEIIRIVSVGAEAAIDGRMPLAACSAAIGHSFSKQKFVGRIFTGELLGKIY